MRKEKITKRYGKRKAQQPWLSTSSPPVVVNDSSDIQIYVDGACQPNPGEGGYAYVIVEKDEVIHEYYRKVSDTTNNRMELSAILAALMHCVSECSDMSVIIYTDSEYCHKGITKWHHGWKSRNWNNVKNADLWIQIVFWVEQAPNVQYRWVRGHNGNKWNEHVDKLAVYAITGEMKEDVVVPVNRATKLLKDTLTYMVMTGGTDTELYRNIEHYISTGE